MNDPLPQYSLVEVVQLLHLPKNYDGWRINQRSPAVGDRGYIVDVLYATGQIAYVVESSAADGTTIWLGDFQREELRPVL